VKAWVADNAKLQHLFFLYPRYSDSAHRADHKYHLFYLIINPFRWKKPTTLKESERGEKSLIFSKIYMVFLNAFLSRCKFFFRFSVKIELEYLWLKTPLVFCLRVIGLIHSLNKSSRNEEQSMHQFFFEISFLYGEKRLTLKISKFGTKSAKWFGTKVGIFQPGELKIWIFKHSLVA
jgi:hypothetical protein